MEKETLTNALMLYGRWQTESDISQGLVKLCMKIKALKVQLTFRKMVLEQAHSDRTSDNLL